MNNFDTGTMHDELNWSDICVHACKLLNQSQNIVFISPSLAMDQPQIVDKAKMDNNTIVFIPTKIEDKIRNTTDYTGAPMREIRQFTREYAASFEYSFVDPGSLTADEKQIFDKKDDLFNLIGGVPNPVKEVLISETMRLNPLTLSDTVGLWNSLKGTIIVKRDQLNSVEMFAGTLLHEAAHALSGHSDVSRDFELALTKIIGNLASQIISEDKSPY